MSETDQTANDSNAGSCSARDHHTVKRQEKFMDQETICQVEQVPSSAAMIDINKQINIPLMSKYQESFPSGDQEIEEGCLGGQFEYNQKTCSEVMDHKLIDSQINQTKINSKNQMKEDGFETGTSYEVVLVSDKDLVAKEFSSLTEKSDCGSISKSREVQVSGNSNNMQDDNSTIEVISQEVCNNSHLEDISQRYLCYICGKSYKQLSHLSRHTKDVHSKEQLNQCTICDTTFTRSWSLIRHLKLHEQRNGTNPTEGPFKCPQCTKTFQQPYNVSRHLLTHTGEKPFECPECKKNFTQHTGLSRHLILHKGSKDFKCEECGKAFARLFVLNRHKLTHTNDKPYKCFVCNKSFIRAIQLEGHMKLHKERDIICKKPA